MTKASRTSIWPYAGIYLLATIALYSFWYFYAYTVIIPSEKLGIAANIIIPFASTSLSYAIFVSKNRRAFTKGEYWSVVVVTTLFKFIFTAGYLIIVVAATGLTNISIFYDTGWISVALIGAVIIFLMNAAGFSIWFGKTLLKLFRIRQVRLDTEPFQ